MFNIPMIAAYCYLIAGPVPCLNPSQSVAYYPIPVILGAEVSSDDNARLAVVRTYARQVTHQSVR